MNRTVSAFVSKLRQLLVISGISDLKVKLSVTIIVPCDARVHKLLQEPLVNVDTPGAGVKSTGSSG